MIVVIQTTQVIDCQILSVGLLEGQSGRDFQVGNVDCFLFGLIVCQSWLLVLALTALLLGVPVVVWILLQLDFDDTIIGCLLEAYVHIVSLLFKTVYLLKVLHWA